MKSLGNVLPAVLSPVLNKQNAHVKTIVFNWETVVGVSFSRFAFPIKIVELEGKQVLHIAVSSSAMGTELYYMRDMIMDRIAVLIGQDTVQDLKIVLRPSK
jgi:hypothetical protein